MKQSINLAWLGRNYVQKTKIPEESSATQKFGTYLIFFI